MTGRDLKLERVQLDLKQIALAVRTGIPRERLSRFENGWQDLQPDELRRIREVLDQVRPDGRRATDTAGVAGKAEQPLYAKEVHR